MRALTPVLIALLAGPALAQAPVQDGPPNVPDAVPAFPEQTEAPEQPSGIDLVVEQVAEGLETPWAVAVLPDAAGYLVTERPGALRHVAIDGTVSGPIAGVPDVRAQAQGGLLDVALDPDFAETRRIYLSFSKPVGLGRSVTAAIRAVLSDDHASLSEVTEIFAQTPPSISPAHYGSRIEPLPDGTLAITTGERFIGRDIAQDITATYGSVVRVTPEGEAAPDNPFLDTPNAVSALWSYGHRNVQGIATQPGTGALWTIEHGPAGGDELNLIEPGGNYGWPIASYGENYNGSSVGDGRTAHAPDFIEPRYYWDPVIAPGGMVFYEGEMFAEWQGDLLASGLVAAALVRLDIDGDTVTGEERLVEGIGRVRDVAVDADGSILIVVDEGDDSRMMRLSR
jgi:glucose/arabinose dehydrogenase